MAVNYSENPLVGAGFLVARLTAIKVIGKYLSLFFWPARLSADYSYNAVPLVGWPIAVAVVPGVLSLIVPDIITRPGSRREFLDPPRKSNNQPRQRMYTGLRLHESTQDALLHLGINPLITPEPWQ